MAETSEKQTAVERVEKLADEVLESLEAGRQSTVEALDDSHPAGGDFQGKRPVTASSPHQRRRRPGRRTVLGADAVTSQHHGQRDQRHSRAVERD